MKFPLGDVLRALLPSWKWLRVLKGIEVKRGDHSILLDEGNVPPLRGSQFDSKPHQPNSGPAPWGPRR
jgi:hypothetical protein